MQDAELPNPDVKRKNIKDAFDILIKAGKLRVPGTKRDRIDSYLSDIKALPPFEDAMACKGRACLNCEGCDSFRYHISEVKEILNAEDVEEETEPLKAASHAIESNMRDIAAMMGAISQRTTVQFSQWEIIKFMRDAILTVLKVDIFVIKKEIKKEPLYRTELPKDVWTVLRTVMIINRMDWWLENVASQQPEKESDVFRLYLVDKRHHTYLPMQMAFPSEDGQKYLTIEEYISTLPLKQRNQILSIQNHFGSSIESTVKWTVNFQG
jgi:hypothetical protein